MGKLSNLPEYNNLTKEEKERLKKIHGDREKTGYNLTGASSVSSRELRKAKSEAKKLPSNE